MSTNESVLLIDICMPPPQDSDDDCLRITGMIDSSHQQEGDVSSFESPESDYNMTPFADVLPAINTTVLPLKTNNVICLPSLPATPYSSRIRPRGESMHRSCELGVLSPSLTRVLKEKYGAHGSKSKLRTPRTLTRLMQQHRDSERHRHRGLNATIKEISRKIPGFEDASNETKIVKLQRIINYICHLEQHIVTLCEDQGLDLEFKNLFLLPHLPKVNDVKKNKRKVTASMNTDQSITDVQANDDIENMAIDISTAVKTSTLRRIKIVTPATTCDNTWSSHAEAPPAADSQNHADESDVAWFENHSHTTSDVACESQEIAHQIIVQYIPEDETEDMVHEDVAAFHSYAKTTTSETPCVASIDKPSIFPQIKSPVIDLMVPIEANPAAQPLIITDTSSKLESRRRGAVDEHVDSGKGDSLEVSARSGSDEVPQYVQRDSGQTLNASSPAQSAQNEDVQVVPSAGEVATTTDEAISAIASVIKTCPNDEDVGPSLTSGRSSRVDHRKSSWMNGFMMYSRLHRKTYIEEHPGVHTSYISKLMGHDWRHLPSVEQQPYRDKAKLYIKQYLAPHARNIDKTTSQNKM